jgi:hypothetical protein
MMRSITIWTTLMILSMLIMAGCSQGQLIDSPEPKAEPPTQEADVVEVTRELPAEEFAVTPDEDVLPTPTEDAASSLTESMTPTLVPFGPTPTPLSTGKSLTLTLPIPTIHIIPREIPMPEIAGLPVDPEQAAALPQVEMAINDLAGRIGILADSISIVVVKEVAWGDASMGCPQPGMAYIQVPQDGLFIRLEANGQTYDYHSGGSREPFLCQQLPQLGKTTPFPQIDIVPPSSSIDE